MVVWSAGIGFLSFQKVEARLACDAAGVNRVRTFATGPTQG